MNWWVKMYFQIQIQKRYYTIIIIFGLIITALITLILQADYLSFIVSSVTLCMALTLTIKALIKRTKLQLSPQDIVFQHPFGLFYSINYNELQNIAITNKGFSLFALSNRKVLLEWKKENSVKVSQALFAPMDPEKFIEEVRRLREGNII
jgi:hypothetical protein